MPFATLGAAPAPEPEPTRSATDDTVAPSQNWENVYEPGHPARPEWLPNYTCKKDGDVWRRHDGSFYDGQYVMPPFDPSKPGNVDLSPESGKSFQRATTFTSMIEYKGPELEQWAIMHAIFGVIHSPELFMKAYALSVADKHTQDPETKKATSAAWKSLIAEANEKSGKDQAARNGDDIHAVTELLDLGTATIDTLPTDYVHPKDGRVADLTKFRPQGLAYLALRDGLGDGPGFKTFPQLVERSVISAERQVVGKFDRIVLIEVPEWDAPGKPRFRLLDVKSGDVDYGNKRDGIGRQMLNYATSDAVWDDEAQQYIGLPELLLEIAGGDMEMADLDLEHGLVAAIPWSVAEGEQPVARLIPIFFEKSGGLAGLKACAEVKGLKRGSSRKLPPLATAVAPVSDVAVAVPELTVVPTTPPAVPKPRTRRKAAPKGEIVDVEVTGSRIVTSEDLFPAADTPATWEQRITACTSKAELGQVRKEAMAASEWTPELLELGKAQLKKFA